MKKLLYILIPVLIVAMVYYSMSGGQSDEEYAQSVLDERAEKEDFLKTSSQSPFVVADQEPESFNYYPIDKKWKVTARVEKITKRQTLNVSNSDGSSQRYLKFAWLHFEIDGQDLKLLVLKPMFSPSYFLGFSDETSGESTYGGGRYLDITDLKADRITLDFNLAYNPYCAYVTDYFCPFPPRENILPVKIEAGEKIYTDH